MAQDGSLSVNCLSPDYALFAARSREFPRRLRGNLRRELRSVGREVERDLERSALSLELRPLPPGRPPTHGHTGLRRRVASGVRVTVREAGSGIEFRIRATHPMSQTLNSASFRHPTFGHRGAGGWVTQASQPWWDRVWDRRRSDIVEAGQKALHDAVGDL